MLPYEFENHLKKNGLQPVYLIHGPESFFRGEAVRLIRETAQQDKIKTDLAEYDAAEKMTRDLFDDLRTPSLFSPRRMMIVDNAANLIGEAFERLGEYVKKPAARTVLVLVTEQLGKPKTTRRRTKGKGGQPAAPDLPSVLKMMVTVECPVLQMRDLPAWCARRAQLHGKALDPGAARTLGELTGTNLGQVDGQIQSLAAYVKDRQRITSDDVIKLVGGDRARTIWELIGATTEGAAPTALRALHRLLQDSENPPVRIISALTREVLRMITLKKLLDARAPAAEIMRVTGMQDWLVRKMSGALRATPAAQLQKRLRLLLEADVACKTGGGDEEWILERLILRLCNA